MNPTVVLLFIFTGVALQIPSSAGLLYRIYLFIFNYVLHKPSQKSSGKFSPFPFTWRKIGWAFFIVLNLSAQAQTNNTQLWHNKERTIHYQPQGNDFILYKGTRKFNRALYGTNTGFRVEAGDLPEFALYMPGMGGNCKIGISINGKSKWITTANQVKTIYRPGTMLYQIKDSLLGKGQIDLSVLAMANAEGMIIKMETTNIPANTSLIIVYGGATGKKFSHKFLLMAVNILLASASYTVPSSPISFANMAAVLLAR